MAKPNAFTATEFCSILKACAENGVRSLQWAGIHVEFGPKISEIPSPPAVAHVPTVEQLQQTEKIAGKSLVESEVAFRQRQLDELRLTDPLEYEQMLRRGEIPLEDEQDGAEDA